MMIFHSYVSLPEGIHIATSVLNQWVQTTAYTRQMVAPVMPKHQSFWNVTWQPKKMGRINDLPEIPQRFQIEDAPAHSIWKSAMFWNKLKLIFHMYLPQSADGNIYWGNPDLFSGE